MRTKNLSTLQHDVVAVTSDTACIVDGENNPSIREHAIPGWIPYGVTFRASLVAKKMDGLV